MVGGPFPYQSSLTASTIQFGISSSRDFDGTSIHQPAQVDWAAGFVEHNGAAQNHKALSWVNLDVVLFVELVLICSLIGHSNRHDSILYGVKYPHELHGSRLAISHFQFRWRNPPVHESQRHN